MDTSSIVSYLRQIPIFVGLDEDEALDLVTCLQSRSLETGEILFSAGDPGDALYIVASGALRVSAMTAQKTDQNVATLEAGAVAGEMALLDDGPRSATLTAAAPTELYFIPQPAFQALRANRRPAAGKTIRFFAHELCRRLRDTNLQIRDFYQDPQASLAVMKRRQQEAMAGVRDRMDSRPDSKISPLQRLRGRRRHKDRRRATQAPPVLEQDRDVIAAYLSEHPAFVALSAGQRVAFAETLVVEPIAPNDVLSEPEDSATCCHLLVSGRVDHLIERPSGTPLRVAHSEPGAFVGHVPLIDGQPHFVASVVVTRGQTLRFDKEAFAALFGADNPAAYGFIDGIGVALAKSVREANENYLAIFSQIGKTIAELETDLQVLRASAASEGVEPDNDGEDEDSLKAMMGYKDQRSG